MKKSIIVLASLLLVSFTGSAMMTSQAAADSVKDQICGGIGTVVDSSDCASGKTSTKKVNSVINTVVNLFTIIVGVIAVIMIVVSGLKFITSGGDSNKISSAKKGILYAVIGLAVVGAAQVITYFTLNTASSSSIIMREQVL